MELKKVTTGDYPIKKDPFIAFEIFDKTVPYYNGGYMNPYRKYWEAYVNPSANSLTKWGRQGIFGESFFLFSSSSDNIGSETLQNVTVSFFSSNELLIQYSQFFYFLASYSSNGCSSFSRF